MILLLSFLQLGSITKVIFLTPLLEFTITQFSLDRIQTRQLPTWKSETHLNDSADTKEKEKHSRQRHREDKKSSDQLPSPPKTDKWSSLLQLQTIVITKPKKEKKRRSTFSFFGNSNRIAPIDTTLVDMNHPVADAVIKGKVGGQVSTPVKRNKKRRSSV